MVAVRSDKFYINKSVITKTGISVTCFLQVNNNDFKNFRP